MKAWEVLYSLFQKFMDWLIKKRYPEHTSLQIMLVQKLIHLLSFYMNRPPRNFLYLR